MVLTQSDLNGALQKEVSILIPVLSPDTRIHHRDHRLHRALFYGEEDQ